MLTGIKNRLYAFFNAPRFVNKDKITLGRNPKIAERCVINADGKSIQIGNNAVLDIGVYVRLWGGQITIGNNIFIGPYTVVYGHGGLTIGNNVLIASHVTIIPANHIFTNPEVPINSQGESQKGIIIEDDVWIATGVTILDGVTIGKGSVIAAGSVVKDSFPENSVIGGVPAKFIKNRS